MIRWSVLTAAAMVGVGGAVVTATTIPPKPPAAPPAPVEVKATIIGQKIGFFNMAKLMKNYDRAKTGVARLNDRKMRMTANLIGMRAMYLDAQKASTNNGILLTPDQLKELAKEQDVRMNSMVKLARQIEDMDRDINKLLNDQATIVITELYDEIRMAVTELAREEGLSAMLTYPDASTPEEMESPMVKELKLKPPAAQPFFLEASVDFTDELLQRLNTRYAAKGEK